ncbi:glycosyltransferase family 4 protein [Desulfonatronum parangueonense]
MRIGVNCFLLHPRAGGVRQYFMALFNELLGDEQNDYVFFHTPNNLPLLEELESERWRKDAVFIADQGEIRGRARDMDLYFCPFGSLWPRPLPLPCVVTLVDIQEVFFPQFFSAVDLYNRELHYVGSTRLAQRVVTISEFSKQTIVERHKISAGKVNVAHLCPDHRFFDPQHHGIRPDLPLEEDYALFPANHWPHKNHETLFQALAWLKRERGLVIRLICTGHDNVAGGSDLSERIAAHGLENEVVKAGYLRVEEMVYLMSRARMLVFPSLFEGFGIPLAEAMAAGCPVTCSKTTSLPEVGGEAVLYFDPDSAEDMALAMERLWTDENLRASLRELGRERVRLFSRQRLAAIHEQAFIAAKAAYRPWLGWLRRLEHGRHVLWTMWKHRRG